MWITSQKFDRNIHIQMEWWYKQNSSLLLWTKNYLTKRKYDTTKQKLSYNFALLLVLTLLGLPQWCACTNTYIQCCSILGPFLMFFVCFSNTYFFIRIFFFFACMVINWEMIIWRLGDWYKSTRHESNAFHSTNTFRADNRPKSLHFSFQQVSKFIQSNIQFSAQKIQQKKWIFSFLQRFEEN